MSPTPTNFHTDFAEMNEAYTYLLTSLGECQEILTALVVNNLALHKSGTYDGFFVKGTRKYNIRRNDVTHKHTPMSMTIFVAGSTIAAATITP